MNFDLKRINLVPLLIPVKIPVTKSTVKQMGTSDWYSVLSTETRGSYLSRPLDVPDRWFLRRPDGATVVTCLPVSCRTFEVVPFLPSYTSLIHFVNTLPHSVLVKMVAGFRRR